MGELIFLVGLPGSGKSTWAKQYKINNNCIVLSSDELRYELFGDINCQDRNTELFQEMNKRTILALKSGKTVIYDATNINSKRRKGLLSQLPKEAIKRCIYFAESITECTLRDLNRTRCVGASIIIKMYKNMQVPMYHEGWDDIAIITNTVDTNDIFNDEIEDYREYKVLLNNLGLQYVIDVAQDTPYHTLSMSRHMYYAYDYIKKYSDDKKLKIAALLHDIGKPICKEYKNKYASYYGHENVSAQITIELLKKYGFNDKDIIYIATLVQLHMRLHSKEFGSKAKEKFINQIGKDLYEKLLLLNNADSSAR